MKSLKLTVTFFFFLLAFFNFSQSNTLVVFSQDPTPFYIVLDGVKKMKLQKRGLSFLVSDKQIVMFKYISRMKA